MSHPVIKVQPIGTITDEQHGESATKYFRCVGLVDRDWVAHRFPGTHCQHEHDCCGHWYANQGQIVGNEIDRTTIVAQSFYLNV
jgi:uncharacterized Ntn-hydrolase superfamily protein